MGDVVIIVVVVIAVFAGSFLAFLTGKKKGIAEGEKSAEDRLQHRSKLVDSQRSTLQKEVEDLNRKLEKYLFFFVRIPEVVKHINSHLSFDDLVNAIMRITKDLIDTDLIELYMYSHDKECLELVAAYKSDRKSGISVKVGQGVVGRAADVQMIVSQAEVTGSMDEAKDERVKMAAPILFKNTLIGVLGVGNIKEKTGNEKRFLAMTADLAGIAIKNCELLSTAKKEAITDALTGLYNKKYFFDTALQALMRAKDYDFPLSVFIFDVDNFKHYNDTQGHSAGDVLLKEMGRLLKSKTRSTDIVSRYGGEEFIVLLQNTEKGHAFAYADGIRKLIAAHPFLHAQKQPLGCVSISGGVATYPMDGESIEALVKNADAALYRSKESGRNQVRKYEPVRFS